jgi:hypothetical protein
MQGNAASGGGISAFMLLIDLAIYVYMALALMAIANKTQTENAWLAWIPIANLWLMVTIAQQEWWWLLLMFIPIVNIVIGIIIYMKIAERLGKPSWWGVMLIIPIVNFVFIGMMAWG